MSSFAGGGPAAISRPNWTRVHLIYFALAAFDLIAIGTGLWLSEYTKRELQQSIVSVDGSNFLHDHAARLQDRAIALTAPAYDLFYHRNARKALAELKSAAADFDAAGSADGFTEDLQHRAGSAVKVPEQESPGAVATYAALLGMPPELMENYESLEHRMRGAKSDVVRLEESAIKSFAAGNLDQSSVQLGRSSLAARNLLQSIVDMGRIADGHTDDIVKAGKESFAFSTRLQYIIGGLILVMVLMVVTYAHFVGKLLRGKFDELAKAHASTGEFAGRLHRVNDEVTRLNMELAANVKRLTEVQTEILRKGKMAQLGHLTATVAHELRNPLGAVRTSAFLLERKIRNKGLGIEPQIERINNGVLRCDNIITQLLDFSRSKSLQSELINFDAWVEKTLSDEAEKLPAIVKLEFEPGLDGRAVPFDPGRMSRVVVNLVANASEAMVGKGDDPSKYTTQKPVITVATCLAGRGIELTVTDCGPGIAPENLLRILDPLFTTKSFGTGLGLPAVEKILQEHGGGIEVASKPGEGACFTAWFPLGDSQQEAA